MKNDVRGVLEILETCIRNSFAGVESPRFVLTATVADRH